MPPGSSYTSRLSEEHASLTSHEVMESLLPATFRAVLVHKGMSDSSVMSATTGPSLPAKTCLCGTTAPLRPPRGPAAWPRPEVTEPRPPPPPRRTPQRGPPGCTRLRPRWEALHRWGGWAFEHGVGWTELPSADVRRLYLGRQHAVRRLHPRLVLARATSSLSGSPRVCYPLPLSHAGICLGQH